jgi:hypothetical protein
MTAIPDAQPVNPLVAFVTSLQERVKGELERVAAYRFADVPEPEEPDRQRHRLKWLPATPRQATAAPLPIADARASMLLRMQSYAAARRVPGILLVRAQPGLGKTYAAIKTAQEHDGRTLYLMPTHAHFEQLQNFPIFNDELWYHWLATHAPVPGVPDDTMCREARHTTRLMGKGWPLSLACKGLCPLWSATCDYRAQSGREERVIAGVHEHITTGLDVRGVNLVIVDEEPLRAFLKPRTIPKADIATGQYAGPITELYDKLRALCETGETWQGKRLLAEIGDILRDVYALVDDFDKLLPAMPLIGDRGDIEKLPAWFLDDLLVLLAGEWEAWRRGEGDWLERVTVHAGSLYLYRRADIWKRLPKRLIIIDATANPEMYRQMFPERELIVYEPPVQQRGKIYQVTGSYNGISQLRDRETAVKQVELCKEIADAAGYDNPGVVTFKAAVPYFAAIFGPDNVAHFGGQRGSNQLANCDAGFVVGSFSPPDTAVMDIVKMLKQDRLQRFAAKVLDSGAIIPLRSEKLVEYDHINEDGLSPWRMVSGLWTDYDLHAAMHSRREAEMIQAVHRFRPLTRDVPIWLLSSIPTGLPLAGVYDDPQLGPEGIDWRAWMKTTRWMAGQDVVTYDSLADALEMDKKYLQNKKWLEKIAEYYSPEWEVSELRRAGQRGRPTKAIQKVFIPHLS